jgi:hypothetical protein
LQPAKGKIFKRKGKREKGIAHHNLVCRIEPMQARLKGRVNVVKHQTKPETRFPQNPPANRATSFHFSYKQGFFLNVCSFLSISLYRSENHDRLPGTFVFGELIGKFNYQSENRKSHNQNHPNQKKFHSNPEFHLLRIRSAKSVQTRQLSGREGGMKWGGAAVEVEGVGGGVQRYVKKENWGHSFGRRTIKKTGREGYARDEER